MCHLCSRVWSLFRVKPCGGESQPIARYEARATSGIVLPGWELIRLTRMCLPSARRVSGKDGELTGGLGSIISAWAFLVLVWGQPSIQSPFKGLGFPLTSSVGSRDSITTYLAHAVRFSLYSVDSSLTLLVDSACDDPGETVKAGLWHQWFYLGCAPICPCLCLLPNLSKWYFELGRGKE